MTNNDEDTSRQAESLWRSDDWADLRWGSPFSDGSAANAAEPIFFIFLERT